MGIFLGIAAALLIGCSARSDRTSDPDAGRSSAAYQGEGAGQKAGDIAAAARAEGALWSFAVLGDTRIATAGEFEAVGRRGRGNRIYPELVEHARSLSPVPEILFVQGDLGSRPARPDHLHLFLDLSLPFRPGCQGVAHAPAGPAEAEGGEMGGPDDAGRPGQAGPCLFTLTGNHDVQDERSLQTYLEVIRPPGGRPYFTVEKGDIRFICLDSETVDRSLWYRLLRWNRRKARIEGEQAVWLDRELRDATKAGRRIIVMLHRPLFPPPFAINRGAGMDRYPEARDRLHRRFVESGVVAVFSSHDHFYHRGEKDGVVYFITGGGGAGLYAPVRYGGFYHLIYVSVTQTSLHVYVVDVEGRVADEVVIR